MNHNRAEERNHMVESQIHARGVTNETVLQAMRDVPRHLFIPKNLASEAYSDYPLPIGHGQTISQPYIVAVMTELVDPKPGDKVLEIGTGSGYQAAILAATGVVVISIERIFDVAEIARKNLKNAGIKGIKVHCGDGTLGFPSGAPYDAIIVTAAAPKIPEPLLAQLKTGGRLIAPIGNRELQQLVRVIKTEDGYFKEGYGGVRFVPLIGSAGWSDSYFR